MRNIYVVGIDLAKEIFQIHGNDKHGRCVGTKRLTRKKLPEFLVNLPKCIVAMEACGGSSYWARKCIAAGHEVKIISPQFVKPFVKSNKNDAADAEAIAEAAVRPNMRFVSMKSAEQQDLQILHRVRERMVKERTAIGNQIRGFLQEYGLVTAKGIVRLKQDLPGMIADEKNELTPTTREILLELLGQLRSRWVQNLVLRCGKNKAAVALANKNARTIWALMATGHEYASSKTMTEQKAA